MNRRIGITGAVVLVTLAAVIALLPHDGLAGKKKETTSVKTGRQVLTGEVVDLDCYLPDPENGRGPDHAGCAKSCLSSGKPSALLSGNRLYVIIGAGDAVPNETIGNVAGYPVKLTGTVAVQNDVPFVFIEAVERTDAAAVRTP